MPQVSVHSRSAIRGFEIWIGRKWDIAFVEGHGGGSLLQIGDELHGLGDIGDEVVAMGLKVAGADVADGELKGVQQSAGTRIVDVAEKDGAHEMGDGDLNGFRVFEHRETVAGLAGKTTCRLLRKW